MNQIESGKTKLETRLEELLDNLNKTLKLHSNTAPIEDYNEYLHLAKEHMESYGSEKCYEIAETLLQYAFFLQRSLNQLNALHYAANVSINKYCASHWDDCDKFVPKEIKIDMIAKTNEGLSKILSYKSELETYIKATTGLSNLVRQRSDIWRDAGRAKKQWT